MNLARIVPRIPTASRLDTFRLLTLIRLRWYALFGVCIALVSARMLNFQGLAWAPLALFVLLGSFYNLLLSRATRLPHAVQVQRIYTLQLILDISALAGLLWSSGGLANPFADLFLLHVVVAALIGRFGAVIAAGALASTAAITLHLLEMNDLLIGRWSPPPFLQDTTRLSALLVNAVAIAALVGTLSRRFQAKEARLSEARDAVKLHEQVLDRVLNGLSAAVEVVSGDRIIWQNEAMGAIEEVDLVLLVVEAPDHAPAKGLPAGSFRIADAEKRILDVCVQADKPVVLAINKVDKIKDKAHLLPVLEAWQGRSSFAAFVPMSATKGTGVEDLVKELVRLMPAGPPLYGPDMLTDRTERFLAGELIREQLFLRLRQELPYSTAIVIEGWEERERGDVVIDAMILVERDSQKGIVVGKAGSMIKDVGTAARAEIAELLGRPAHVRLQVKVAADWTESQRELARLGYERSR